MAAAIFAMIMAMMASPASTFAELRVGEPEWNAKNDKGDSTSASKWTVKNQNTTCIEVMTLCVDCTEANLCQKDADKKVYEPPVGKCYSPSLLWPGDDAWGPFDVLDTWSSSSSLPSTSSSFQHLDNISSNGTRTRSQFLPPNTLTRAFYATKDGSCGGSATDNYDLPVDTCLGPFGKPRPWGVFTSKCA